MTDIARAVLVGRLTRPPELNDSGKVLTLSLAVNRREKGLDGEWGEAVSFFDIKVFGNRAQGLAGFLDKGRQVAVDARVVQERWEKDGEKRSTIRFYADEVSPLGSRTDQPASQAATADQTPFDPPEPQAAVTETDEIPF